MQKQEINPTNAELEILNLLWESEPMTVKEVHQCLLNTKEIGYTTALKLMQKMTEKGLLKREAQGKSHLYYSVFRKEETRGKLLDKFLDTTFGGSASKLVMQLVGNKKTSKKELEEIKKLIDSMDSNKEI